MTSRQSSYGMGAPGHINRQADLDFGVSPSTGMHAPRGSPRIRSAPGAVPLANAPAHQVGLHLAPTTRAEGTEQVYTGASERALRRYERQTGVAWEHDLERFVDWLADWRSGLAPSAWRWNRAALSYHFERQGYSELVANIRALNPAPKPHTSLRAPRTSAGKAKRWPASKAIDAARSLGSSPNRTETHELVGFWLLAGGLVGLRPVECPTARVITKGDERRLRVVNAKATNGRGNGPSRELVLNALRPQEQAIIDKFLQLIQTAVTRDGWGSVYGRCRKLLYREMRRGVLVNQHIPTLYSLRHQFVADAKDAQVDPRAIAAMLGHESLSSQRNYGGRRRKGRGGFRVSPSFEDLSRLAGREVAVELLSPTGEGLR